MHELRKDILLGRLVAVLSESKAPSEYNLSSNDVKNDTNCILCHGRESEIPSEIMSIRKHSARQDKLGCWGRSIQSFEPVFQTEGALGIRGLGIYDKMNSAGANEIIIESPEHTKRLEDMRSEQVAGVIALYKNRLIDLQQDSRVIYILIIYKNSGKDAGEIFSHPTSFLIATPVIPKKVKDELDNAKQYYSYKERCNLL